jgi:hypothetical protein
MPNDGRGGPLAPRVTTYRVLLHKEHKMRARMTGTNHIPIDTGPKIDHINS